MSFHIFCISDMWETSFITTTRQTGLQKKTHGFEWSDSLSQKLRREPESARLDVNVEALTSISTSPTANKREQKRKRSKKCKWLRKETIKKKRPRMQSEAMEKLTRSSGVRITKIRGFGNSVENKGKQQRQGERSNGAGRMRV